MLKSSCPASEIGLRKRLMTELAYGDAAKDWANKLILGESRGPGDIDNAMRRLARRYDVPYRVLWALRYRPAKDPRTLIYFRLQAAWQDFRERQLKALQHDIEVTQIIAGPHANSVRAAKTLVDPEMGGCGMTALPAPRLNRLSVAVTATANVLGAGPSNPAAARAGKIPGSANAIAGLSAQCA